MTTEGSDAGLLTIALSDKCILSAEGSRGRQWERERERRARRTRSAEGHGQLNGEDNAKLKSSFVVAQCS